jgi:Arc/MetJ family transcription regulator
MPEITSKRRGRPTSSGPAVRRKNLNIDQDKLDRVVEALGVNTETEAVDQALDLVLFRDELVAGISRIAGTGGIENYFDDHLEA